MVRDDDIAAHIGGLKSGPFHQAGADRIVDRRLVEECLSLARARSLLVLFGIPSLPGVSVVSWYFALDKSPPVNHDSDDGVGMDDLRLVIIRHSVSSITDAVIAVRVAF